MWKRKRRRDSHRTRRERRACPGELVQMDASEHKWLEDRCGGEIHLLAMIDDATGIVRARFYRAENAANYMDLVQHYLLAKGRPVALYTDRHGIFRAEDNQGQPRETQFSRACRELEIQLILARSPQAKGRVERLFGTLHNRWVKDLRLAGVSTLDAANALLNKALLPAFNHAFAKEPASPNNAHRALGGAFDLASILSFREQRAIANDYTFRYRQKHYQIPGPALPGMRGGRVTIEERLDGSRVFCFGNKMLNCKCINPPPAPANPSPPGPPTPLSLTLYSHPAVKARVTKAKGRSRTRRDRPPAGLTLTGRSGRTPALPYPPVSKSCGRSKNAWRPAHNHPWR